MHLLAHESSLGDEVINAVTAMRIDPWRKGWWQTVWRASIVLKLESLSILPPSYPSESQQRQLVSQPHNTPPWPLTSKRDCPSCWQHHRTWVPWRGCASNPKAPFALVSCWSPCRVSWLFTFSQQMILPLYHIIVTNAAHPSSPRHSFPSLPPPTIQ